MGPNSLNASDLFVDEDPDLGKSNDIFLDYDPDTLDKFQTADIFTDHDPDALETKASQLSPTDQRVRQNYYAPEKSAQEIKQMSMWDRMEYAKQLEKEFEYRQAKGFSKGAVSGATLGASEYIPGMDQAEDDMLYGFGELTGSVLPIEAFYNVLGRPLVKAAAKSPYAQKALGALARMTGFGLTGSAYETSKEAIRTGEAPDINDVVKHGAQWALFDGALQVTGKAFSFAQNLMRSPNRQKTLNDVISQLAKENINPELNPEQYAGRAEEILESKFPKPEAEGELNTPEIVEVAKNPEATTFTTAKGSTYTVEGNKTTRNKAERPEHGPNEKGPQPQSEKTWYVSSEDATKLGEAQTSGHGKRIVELPDGKLGVMYTEGPNAGKIEARTVVTAKSKPEVDLHPVEVWEGGQKFHFGNKIEKFEVEKPEISETKTPETQINYKDRVKKIETKIKESADIYKDRVKKKEPEIKEKPISVMPQPIVETTGKGAREQIEYTKSSVDKTIDAVNETIKAAKTPGESLKRLGSETNKAIFNFLAPLEKMEAEIPIPERVSTKIKLAQSANSEINSVLENGIFSNITGRFEHGGLKEAYGDLQWKKFTKGLKPEEYNVQELNEYRHSRQALKRQAEGKKTGIDTAEAKKAISEFKEKYEPISKRIRQFNRAVLETYGTDLIGETKLDRWDKDFETSLYRLMDSGENSILKSGSLKPKQPFKKFKGSERKHIPASESDIYNTSMLVQNSRKNDAILKYMEGVQKGQLEGTIRKGKNNPVPTTLLDDLDIPMDQLDVAETVYNQTRKNSFTPDKNILKAWKNGQPIEIQVPDEVFEIYSTFSPQDSGVLSNLFSATNRLFSRGISIEPRKFLSIFGRDALSSLIYSRTGSNPISIFEAMGDTFGNTEAYKQFKAMGGDVYAARLAERIDRVNKLDDLISPGSKGIMVPWDKMVSYFKKYPEILSNVSMSVPMAEYNRAIAKYGNTYEGRLMAAMEARRVTYDPTRRGGSKILREFGNYIPFQNVSLQDPSMLASNLKNKSAWVKGMTAISIPTMILKMYNDDNPDYQALTPVDKAAFWHIYSGESHYRIPIPWLLGTTFKVGTELFYDQIKAAANADDKKAKEAWKGMFDNFAENVSGGMPPLLQTSIEAMTGKSASSPLGLLLGSESRAPEVVPRRLQDLPPELQYTEKTSQLSRWFGKHWGVSPVKLDKMIKNFGGLVAADALALTDEMAYFSGMAEDKRPEQNEKNYLLLGNFVTDSTPSRTKYANEFYEYLREATLDKNAQKVIREKGITDSGLEPIQTHGVNWFMYNRDVSKMFKEMRNIESDSKISPKDKKRLMTNLQKKINATYKSAVDAADKSKREKKKS